MAVNRSQMIERLLHGDDHSLPSTSHASWEDIETFENDNFCEVEAKLAHLDNLIWGKLIVMERNTRTAKAYLRAPAVKLDGSQTDFDGTRFGLRRYNNPIRDSAGEQCMNSLDEGLVLRVDSEGNVWAHTSARLSIWTSKGMQSGKIGPRSDVRIFDLRDFRTRLLEKSHDCMSRKQLLSSSVVYIKLSPSPALHCPVWFCLVHLIAVELTTMLHPISSTGNCSPAASSAISSSHSGSSPSSSSISSHDHSPTEHTLPLIMTTMASRSALLLAEMDANKPLPIPKESPSENSSSPTSSSARSGSERLLIPTRGRPMERQPYERRDRSCGPLDLIISGHARRDSNNNHHPMPPTMQPGNRNRGGVKKRIDRSNITPFMEARCQSGGGLAAQAPRLSSSVVDLRNLDNLRRPAYFSQPIGVRGGSGHAGARIGRAGY